MPQTILQRSPRIVAAPWIFAVLTAADDTVELEMVVLIFENSDFIYMLNQAAGDRAILAKQLNISPHQLSYVTHSGAGEGLLFYGNVILPFQDHFPKNTELYKLMTTRFSDDVVKMEA